MTGKMSLSEALSIGVQTTVIGLLIVFAVLVILMLVLYAMKYIFASKTKQAETVQKAEPQKVQAPTAVVSDDADDEELIAVLTAAVAASLNTSTYNLKIKSYRRVGNNAPAWNRAGLNEVIDSHY